MPIRNLATPLLRTAHLLSICAWIGGGLGVAQLLLLDLQTTRAGDLQAFNRAIEAIDNWIIAPGACATLLSGLTLAHARRLSVMGTTWLRLKFISTTVAILFGFFVVAHWLGRMHVYAIRDGFILFDDRLYSRAYIIAATGCAIQAVVVLVLLTASVLRPRFASTGGKRCSRFPFTARSLSP